MNQSKNGLLGTHVSSVMERSAPKDTWKFDFALLSLFSSVEPESEEVESPARPGMVKWTPALVPTCVAGVARE